MFSSQWRGIALTGSGGGCPTTPPPPAPGAPAALHEVGGAAVASPGNLVTRFHPALLTTPPHRRHPGEFRHTKSEGGPTPTGRVETASVIAPSVRDVLSDVYDPCCRDKGISVVDMGLLHRAEIDGAAARVELMLTSGRRPL